MAGKKLFFKQIGLVGITRFVIGFRSLLLVPVLTKNLGAYEYGIWAQILVTISLFIPFATFGQGATIVRFLGSAKNKKESQELMYSILVVVLFFCTILALIWIMLANIIALDFLKNAAMIPVVKIASLIMIFGAINQLLYSFFTAIRSIKKYCAFMILENVVEIAIVSHAVTEGFGVSGAIIALLISNITMTVILFYSVISDIGFKLPVFSNLKSYLKYGTPMTLTVIFVWIIHSSDQYLIAYFMGSSQVGIYATAYSLGFIIKLIMDSIGFILYPTVSTLWDKSNMSDFKMYISYSLRYYLMITIPCIFGLSILGKELILLLSTQEFVSGANIIPLVTSGMTIYGFYSYFSKVLTSNMRTDLLGLVLGISAGINVILNILLIPIFGIMGAAFATFISYVFSGVAIYILSRRYLNFEMDWSFVTKCIIASTIMAFLIKIVNPSGFVGVIVVVIFGLLAYIINLLFLSGFSKEETELIKSYLMSLFDFLKRKV